MKDFLISEMKTECSQRTNCFSCPCYDICLAFYDKETPNAFHIPYPRKAILKTVVEEMTDACL